MYGISEKKEKNLLSKMSELQISESDIIEKFIRSSGKGGQKTNKTSNCVYIKHIPSGIEIKCDTSRQRSINRFLARRRLVLKIERIKHNKLSEIQKKINKIRKQKKKRSKRAKNKILSDKRKLSQKKELRKKLDLSTE